jgi:hypothetical protein
MRPAAAHLHRGQQTTALPHAPPPAAAPPQVAGSVVGDGQDQGVLVVVKTHGHTVVANALFEHVVGKPVCYLKGLYL